MLEEFKRYIFGNDLIKQGTSVLLAVSGGIDSMVMTHLFLQLDYKIGIAHCNFKLRATESEQDEEMVRNYAFAHNIPFFSTSFETKTFAAKNGLSVQMAARNLRYSWFEEIRKENNFDKIAVGHNQNDNIETLMINLIRGTGIAGLTGIRPINDRIIRPLLFASRQDITDYCLQNQLMFLEDRSNADTKYTRNKIRHLVLPVLKEINPSIEDTLSKTAERFTGINEILNEYISGIRSNISEIKDNSIVFDICLLKDYLHNHTVIFELFRPFGINNCQLGDLVKVINGKTGGKIYTDKHRIIKNRKEIIVSVADTSVKNFFNIQTRKEFKKVPFINSAAYLDITESFEIPSDESIACVDSDKISFPMIIRKWKKGDHFYPLGMNQKKKLSDYFIDNKYSLLDKETKFILESEGKIVWIIGDRIDNRFRITDSTKKVLVLKTNIIGIKKVIENESRNRNICEQ